MLKKIFLFFSILLFSSPVGAASYVQLTNTQASLISQYDSIQPQKPFKVAVRLQHKKEWHSYWKNPGEAGIPTSLSWKLPDGFKAGDINWPAPEHLREGPLVVYAHHGDLLLPVTITPPDNIQAGESVHIAVKADWLVCKEICIPESAELNISLDVIDTAPEKAMYAELFEQHARNQPKKLTQAGSYFVKGKSIVFSIPRESLAKDHINEAIFFPHQTNVLVYSAKQKLISDDNILTITSETAENTYGGIVTGILSVKTPADTSHYDITLKPMVTVGTAENEIVHQAQNQPLDDSFLLVLLFAVIGGLILNLMPCVLPVLSLKAFAIVKKSGKEHGQIMKLGIAYTAGIMLSFALVAGVLISLQHAGEAVGWGYQMQSPAFIAFLIYLLFLVGLNLSGLFNLPVLFGSVGSDLTDESSTHGSFMTGVLATAVATPCTAPFMASAIGVALTMPTWKAMLVFEALAFGLALPFLLISIFPALLRFLPKPGAWMETLKQFLAFPMYASVIWLLWVLTIQTGPSGMVIALVGMLAIITIIWMKNIYVGKEHRYHIIATLLLIVVFALSLPALSKLDGATLSPESSEDMASIPYSPTKLEQLRTEGTPVFVNATAAWCITCQVNATIALNTEGSTRAFNDNGVALMIADWTRQNPDISKFLKSFGYQGVPLYVYYPPNKEPIVLPQILSEDLIVSTITQK